MKEYTFEEVQRYTVVYSTVAALADVADDFDAELGYLTGDPIDDFELDEMLFKPENIQYKEETVKKVFVQKPIINVAQVSKFRCGVELLIEKLVFQEKLARKSLRYTYKLA